MRVNVYAEEMTNRVEIISKEIEGQAFTGLRFYLELPASFIREPLQEGGYAERPAATSDTTQAKHYQAPFIHHPGDDDSSAVTIWGKRDLRVVLQRALDMLDQHYGASVVGETEDCDCFVIDAETCATLFELDTERCPCACHLVESQNASLSRQS